MKTYLAYLMLISALFSIVSCKNQDPVDYNNSVIELQRNSVYSIDKLKKAIDNFNTANQSKSLEEINVAYDTAYFTINNGIESLKNMKPFKKDDTLRLAAISLLESYSEIIQNNYKKMTEIYKLPVDQYTDEDRASFQQLDLQANKKLDIVFKKFLEVQKSFAKKYNLEIE